MKRILGHLGFMMAGSGPVVKVAVPSWRSDVHGKADIVEEIVRIVGVDKVPMTPFERGDAPRKPVLTAIQLRTRRAKRALAARGMVEAVTWSFIAKPAAELFGGGQGELALANPIASDLSDMRPSLLPGLVAAAQANADRGFPDVALFEVGQVFKGDRPGGSTDRGRRRSPRLCVLKGHRAGTGPARPRRTRSTPRPMRSRCWPPPARRCRRCRSCPAARTGCIRGVPAPSRSARKTCWAISASCIRARWKRSAPTARLIAFEVILDRIPDAKQKPTRAKPVLELSPFQPVSRDFAFIVDRGVKAGDIVRAAQGVDKKLITDVTVFDVYEGKGIDDGKKSSPSP